MFSDVHLGADLVQHARPWTADRLAQELRLDRDLASMLEHYRSNADPQRPWTLVIAGDFCDFMGMSICPRADVELRTPLTKEERTHGLGTAGDHGAHKMRAIAERHPLVFEKLAAFVADGHHIVLIRGNHDVEFYWEESRQAFVEVLLSHAGSAVEGDAARAAFVERVAFRHWFFYVDGLVYVEHGHQYDETCCYPNVLAPLSPRDPRRLWYSFSDILLRYVVRPTRGMSSEGHEDTTMLHYLRLAFSMGIAGCAGLGHRFARAVIELFRNWRDHLSPRAHELRDEHERHMQPLAERFRLSVDKIRALASLWARPVTGGFFSILHSVFLDLLVAIGGSALLIVALALFEVVPPLYLPAIALALTGALYAWIKSSRVFDAPSALRDGARRVAEVLPARFVVMGHTHAPVVELLPGGATYINLGGWAVDDLDGRPHYGAAAYTHLVIRTTQGEPHAELRRWRPDGQPESFEETDASAESGVRKHPTRQCSSSVEAA